MINCMKGRDIYIYKQVIHGLDSSMENTAYSASVLNEGYSIMALCGNPIGNLADLLSQHVIINGRNIALIQHHPALKERAEREMLLPGRVEELSDGEFSALLEDVFAYRRIEKGLAFLK